MLKRNVLVTGTGGQSVGSGILHALLRSSPKVSSRWNVIAADAAPFAWGLYRAPKAILLPLANSPHYIPTLKKFISKYKINAIVPGTQPEVEILSQKATDLDACIVTNRKGLIPLMMDKLKLQNALSHLGINFIETRPLWEWKNVAQRHGFPLILKPRKNSGGSKGLRIIANEKEMKYVLTSVDKNSPFCVQPYIGNSEEEYTIGVLTDKDGMLIDSILMKRKLLGLSLLESRNIGNKSYAISTGYSQGFIIKHKLIQSFCEKLAIKMDSRGPLNIQLRLHKGKPYIFEFHPRFSGTTPIRADVGFNEVDILLRNFLDGEKFSRFPYRYNVAAIRAFEHVIVSVAQLKKKCL